jgi:shikimate kinase
MLIFITGYMCAGKTTLGKSLAKRLNCRFYDLDELIEAATGITIREFFEKFSEEDFRIKEREVLLNHIEDEETVMATGGGTACFADNMELMNRNGITVFLDTPVETIIERLAGSARTRPLLKNILADQLAAFIKQHLDSRRGFYEKALIRADGEDIKEILDAVRSATCGR